MSGGWENWRSGLFLHDDLGRRTTGNIPGTAAKGEIQLASYHTDPDVILRAKLVDE